MILNNKRLAPIALTVIHALAVSFIFLLIKQLSTSMPSSRAVFFYRLCVLIAMLPLIAKEGLKVAKTKYFFRHVMRGLCSMTGSLLFMKGLESIEVGYATSIGCLEQVFIALMGILYFKERFTVTKLSSIIISFVGALLIITPQLFVQLYKFCLGQESIVIWSYNSAYWYILGATLLWTLNAAFIKVLGRTESITTQSLYNLSVATILGYVVSYGKWEPLWDFVGISIPKITGFIPFGSVDFTTTQILTILALGACCFIHTFSYVFSISYGELSTVATFQYLRLPFGALLGYIFMQEIPSSLSLLGQTTIFIAGICLARETAKDKLQK